MDQFREGLCTLNFLDTYLKTNPDLWIQFFVNTGTQELNPGINSTISNYF